MNIESSIGFVGVRNAIAQRHFVIGFVGVRNALTYYYDHQEEIKEQIRKDDLLETEMKNLIPSKSPR